MHNLAASDAIDRQQSIVYLIDDDPLILETFAHLLERSGYNVKSFMLASDFLASDFLASDFLASDFIEQYANACIVCDFNMPGKDGLELLNELSQFSLVPVVMMSGSATPKTIVNGFRSGAVHFLIKPFDADELLAAVDEALLKHQMVIIEESDRKVFVDRKMSLTPRELEVISLVAQGQLNKQISATLNIALRTVKLHRHRAMEKLQLRKTVELSRLREKGIL